MFTMEAQFPQLSVCVRLGQHPLSTSGCQLSGLTWDTRQVLILEGARLTPKQSTCPGAQMIDLSGIFQIQFQQLVISPIRKPFLESGQKTWRQTICENNGNWHTVLTQEQCFLVTSQKPLPRAHIWTKTPQNFSLRPRAPLHGLRWSSLEMWGRDAWEAAGQQRGLGQLTAGKGSALSPSLRAPQRRAREV